MSDHTLDAMFVAIFLPLRPLFLIKHLELGNTHGPIRKASNDFELASHRFNKASQSAQVDVRTAFELRYTGLVDM
jgi:hypothetical protein